MNSQRLALTVEWVQGDLLTDVACDAVLANLPYVADDELLPPEVALYEPQAALLGGHDGLDVVRRLIEQAADREDVKLIALEIGHTQAGATSALLEEAGFGQVERLRDLAGHERVVLGRR